MFKKIIFLQGIGDLNNVFLLKMGELRDTNQNSSEIESESLTTTMSNLNSLNESMPEVMQGTRWNYEQIPEFLDFFIQPLV